MPKQKDYKKVWGVDVTKALKGKTIKSARYMTDKEVQDYGWYKSAVIIFFTDGSYMIPSADDEGNEGGAIFTSIKNLEVIPTI